MELYLKNMNASGTSMNFKFNSVGVDYRLPFEATEFVPLNIFDKKIFNGAVDIALELGQPISKDLTLRSRTDWVGDHLWKMGKNIPGTSFTQEIAFDQKMGRDLTLSVFYRYFNVPSKISAYGVAVPVYSDLLGIGLNYRF